MIKAILFDWGGVLIENPDHGLMEYCANALCTKVDILKPVFTQYEHLFQRGEIDETDLWISVCETIGITAPTSTSIWKDAVKYAFVDKQETYQLLQNLKKNGYKTGFLSNTELPAVEHFFEKKYDHFFDALIFSCNEKTAKPEEKIFKIALEKLKVKPEETVFIDDKLINIEMACKIGINGIVFKSIKQVKEQLLILSVNIK